MHRIKLFMMVLMVFVQAAFTQNGSIQVDGETRTFIAYAPSGIPDNPALVISMHGLTGSASQQRLMTRFDDIADREKFVVVYPDGIDNQWDLFGTKDVNFILTLVDSMTDRYNIDQKKVYATGFSMGGMMSYKLACSEADKFAAIGPAGGYLLGGGVLGCTPSRAMPILHIHGSEDGVVDFNGLASYIDGWIERNGCPETVQITEPYPESNANSAVTKEYYGPCDQGSEIIVLTVEGMGHAYPGSFGSQDIKASEEFWSFFKNHTTTSVGISKSIHDSPRTTQNVSVTYSRGVIQLSGETALHTVQVFDIRGRIVFSWDAGNGALQSPILTVGQLTSGMYLVNVDNAAAMATLNVVVP